MDDLLCIENLAVEFENYQGVSQVLDSVGFSIRRGEIFGLVGESGCGKSVTARAILRLIADPPGRIVGGRIFFRGEDLLKMSNKSMRRIRGNDISMIFQEPMSSLNPVFTVGNQMREVVRVHRGLKRREADKVCADMLKKVRMPDPYETLKKYPHELSGGMRQRVMIAMELACDPALLIADEPTTALDVTVQGQVLAILTGLSRERKISVLMITHDMGVVAQVCDRVAVMYAGRVVELADVFELFANPLHPYTRGLISSIPDLDGEKEGLSDGKGDSTLYCIPGTVPNPIDPPSGCRFHPRCEFGFQKCARETPELKEAVQDHWAACFLVEGDEAWSR